MAQPNIRHLRARVRRVVARLARRDPEALESWLQEAEQIAAEQREAGKQAGRTGVA